MRLDKTNGIIESFILTLLFVVPIVLFMDYNFFILFYFCVVVFILVGIMCQIFSTEQTLSLSLIKNVYETRKNKSKK